ncbi:ribose 5-phosphate isomerase B [Clostridium sp.]|uniref:ribose 5-phosphate isomerase B n=1 Tax=Clostridium sp. TaxID=1506 RepID=UPI00284E9230|nr:ribose 5-phosphate isomerase B [Clostridium sp.]MDR3595370.1 ribose 5-phosphate isomerase B [Clostridium sp.]
MKISIGSDHAGFLLKKEIIKHLKNRGYGVNDFGTFDEESCDYADYALKVAEDVRDKNCDFGILICGTGIGISIAANKVVGVRAALCSDAFSAYACREHNNANILALGQRVVGVGVALDIVDKFLNTEFEGGRHQRRLDKVAEIETKYCK